MDFPQCGEVGWGRPVDEGLPPSYQGLGSMWAGCGGRVLAVDCMGHEGYARPSTVAKFPAAGTKPEIQHWSSRALAERRMLMWNAVQQVISPKRVPWMQHSTAVQLLPPSTPWTPRWYSGTCKLRSCNPLTLSLYHHQQRARPRRYFLAGSSRCPPPPPPRAACPRHMQPPVWGAAHLRLDHQLHVAVEVAVLQKDFGPVHELDRGQLKPDVLPRGGQPQDLCRPQAERTTGPVRT